MGLMSWFQDLSRSEAHHLVLAPIPPERQDPPVKEVTLLAEKHYFRVWLAEMFLRDDGHLFRNFVPVVHSVVRLQFADKPAQELPYVAGPQDLGLGTTTLGRGVQINHALTNLLPFRGGRVSISAGLFAYKSKDFFQGLSQVLHDVTGLLNVGQLSTVLKVVDTAVVGFQNLLGAGDKDVHLLYYQGYGGDTPNGGTSLRSGYVAIINTDEAAFDKNKLFVKRSRLCYGDAIASAKPLNGYDYMLLRIEATEGRDDFLTFDTFSKLLNDAIREGNKDRATGDAIIDTAVVAAWSSPDLTVTDRYRIAKALRDMYEQALPPSRPAKVRNLSSLKTQWNKRILSMDIDAAVKKVDSLSREGKISLDRFLTDIR